ncbi:MAG: hypothetical protein ACLFP2_00980 [Candidatus Woesearchaeota archaeon]
MDIQDYLLQWAKEYFRNKDIIYKKILEINESKNHLDIAYNDKTIKVYGFESLEEIAKVAGEHVSVVVFNTEDNLKILQSLWKELTKHRNLFIYFINPASVRDQKWIISPYVHDKIADKKTLKTGLKAMFDSVTPISQPEIKKIIKKNQF